MYIGESRGRTKGRFGRDPNVTLFRRPLGQLPKTKTLGSRGWDRGTVQAGTECGFILATPGPVDHKIKSHWGVAGWDKGSVRAGSKCDFILVSPGPVAHEINSHWGFAGCDQGDLSQLSTKLNHIGESRVGPKGGSGWNRMRTARIVGRSGAIPAPL